MLHLFHVEIDLSQVRVPENPGYDFIDRPPESTHGYEELDDMEN